VNGSARSWGLATEDGGDGEKAVLGAAASSSDATVLGRSDLPNKHEVQTDKKLI